MAYCGYRYGRYYNCTSSRWSSWGRWALLGALIFVVLLIFILYACISSRRRRKMGYQPYRGTAWTLGRNNNPTNYNNNSNLANNNATQYQGTGYYGKENEQGYAPPPPAYGANTVQPGMYQPPTAPPPVAQQGQGWYR